MECLDCRRQILAAPRDADDALTAHLDRCAGCARFRRETLHLDYQLEKALRVQVPDYLPARIIMRRATRSQRTIPWGIAAVLSLCVLIASTIGIRARDVPATQWSQAVERTLRAGEREPTLDRNEIAALLKEFGVALDQDVGRIVAAQPCSVADRDGIHLILDGASGPATVLILPHNNVPHEIKIDTQFGVGVVAPCPRGSIAVVAGTPNEVAAVRQRVEQALTFI